MAKSVYITLSEPCAQSFVQVVASPDLADEKVKLVTSEFKAEEIIYITAFEEYADKKVYVMNPEADLFESILKPPDSMRCFAGAGRHTAQEWREYTAEEWIGLGIQQRENENFAMAREAFSRAASINPSSSTSRAAHSEEIRMNALLNQYRPQKRYRKS